MPIVAAKATGAAAQDFLARARENGIAIGENAGLFATLAKDGRVGQAIPRATFQPVAQMLVRAGFSG